MTNTRKYYEGREVNSFGAKNHRVDLATFGDVMGGVLNNSIMNKTTELGFTWDLVNGSLYTYHDARGNEYDEAEAQNRIDELDTLIDEATSDFDDYDDEDVSEEVKEWKTDIEYLENPDGEKEIYQYFIISDKAAEILMRDSESQILFYNSDLDMYIWGVTTYGTSWKMLLTDISLND